MGMDMIGFKDLEEAKEDPTQIKPKSSEGWEQLSDKEFTDLMKQMQNPIELHKELAVKIKVFLDKHIDNEMENLGRLSEHTLKWVRVYSDNLEKIQKAIYGSKNLNLNVSVSHSQIASQIRKYQTSSLESHSEDIIEEREDDGTNQ